MLIYPIVLSLSGSVSLSLSLSPSVFLFLCLSLPLCLCLSLAFCLSLPLCLSLSLCLSPQRWVKKCFPKFKVNYIFLSLMKCSATITMNKPQTHAHMSTHTHPHMHTIFYYTFGHNVYFSTFCCTVFLLLWLMILNKHLKYEGLYSTKTPTNVFSLIINVKGKCCSRFPLLPKTQLIDM